MTIKQHQCIKGGKKTKDRGQKNLKNQFFVGRPILTLWSNVKRGLAGDPAAHFHTAGHQGRSALAILDGAALEPHSIHSSRPPGTVVGRWSDYGVITRWKMGSCNPYNLTNGLQLELSMVNMD